MDLNKKEQAKIKFLENVDLKPKSFAEIVKKYGLRKPSNYNCKSMYEAFTKVNAHDTEKMQMQDIFELNKVTYDHWYDYISKFKSPEYVKGMQLSSRNVSSKSIEYLRNVFAQGEKVSDDYLCSILQKINEFLSEDKYKKENMAMEDVANLIYGENLDPVLIKARLGVFSAQGGGVPLSKDKNGSIIVRKDFVHTYPFVKSNGANIDCRLYLNLKANNIKPVAEKLMEQCFKDKKGKLYFKHWTADDRNDTFLIYTDYEKAQYYVDVLKNMKKESPHLFVGAEKTNPFLATIDGFIGFGEEPTYTHSSFNAERSEALNEFLGDEYKKERKKIGNYKGALTTSNGLNVDLKNYMMIKYKEAFKDSLRKAQEDILNGNLPKKYQDDKKASQNYIDLQNNLWDACRNDMPTSLMGEFEKLADRAIEDFKLGRAIGSGCGIDIRTKKRELFDNNPYYDKELSEKGYLRYTYRYEFDMDKHLFDIFGADKRIESRITDENLKPYLEKHHISSINPALNIESEATLSKVRTN